MVDYTVGLLAEAAAGALQSRWDTLRQAARGGDRTGGGGLDAPTSSSLGRGS